MAKKNRAKAYFRSTPAYGGIFCAMRNKKRESQHRTPLKRLAATYFSTNKRSIIGDAGLNFSVRNGKRWTPAL